MVRMKMLARSHIWWLRIDEDIEKYVTCCSTCQANRNISTHKTIFTWPSTTFPFERIHIDFVHFKNQNCLIIFDVFSKYLDILIMSSTTAKSFISKLFKFFSIFGLPSSLVSDNGPPFHSFEFLSFLKNQDIKKIPIPAYHPSSNGSAERAVQTAKSSLKCFF